MKIKSKKSLSEDGMEEQFRKAQLRLLLLPRHDGVLTIREILEDDAFYYVIMDKANGGTLFSSLVHEFSDGNVPAKVLRKSMRDILEAVAHIHRHGILHRDIKPDNLVVQASSTSSSSSKNSAISKVQLIDFDVADTDWCPSSRKKRTDLFVGTLRHSAPEAVLGYFSERSDLYSVGTVLYLLMTGKNAYHNEVYETGNSFRSLACVNERMSTAKVAWEPQVWDSQLACLDLCRRLLSFDPAGRPCSAQQALQHPWFAEDNDVVLGT